MSVTIVKQYSVFLINEPGSLENFSNLFIKENINLISLSQDVRYDSAVVRFAVRPEDEISHTLTAAGFTSVKTDAICLDVPNRVGLMHDIGAALAEKNINITTIYGTQIGDNTRWIIVVNDIPKALNILESSRLFN
jgi:hypothetical protein